MQISSFFGHVADRVSRAAGHPVTFVCCCMLIVIWGASGPMFHFSDAWQLVINTGTPIVTFLMVFLIQNRTARARHCRRNSTNSSAQARRRTHSSVSSIWRRKRLIAFRERCAQAARRIAGERAVTKANKAAKKAAEKA
jgi:low affinity Fe/Cu permease